MNTGSRGKMDPELAKTMEDAKQTSPSLDTPSHICKALCSITFSLNMCGQLGLSMGVGGKSHCHSQGDKAEHIEPGDGQGHGFWNQTAGLKYWFWLFLVVKPWAMDSTSCT